MGSLDEDPVFELVEPKTPTGQDAAIANSRSGPQGESAAEQAKTTRVESEEYLDAQDGTDRV